MTRPSGMILLPFILLLVSCFSGGQLQAQSNPCKTGMTRIVRIPVTVIGVNSTTEPSSLALSKGASDELPEGPDGFDVLDDGSLLITDPLRKGLGVFDSSGKFRKEWRIGFAADSVTISPNGVVLVREASTEDFHSFDREGAERPADGIKPMVRAEAHVVTGKNAGTVMRPAVRGTGNPLAIQLDKPGLSLLSLESLGTDEKGDTYVALETTVAGGNADSVSVNKYVRRYSSDGKLLGEIGDIPLDYYVPPIDELRIHKGIVYQLQTTSSEVRINVWDTGQLCAHPSQ